MNRLAIITVGKTHSGKSTFAKYLEKRLANSIVVDQDNHAEILLNYYPALIPEIGPNEIKFALTRTIVDYVVNQTDCHLILCNSNRNAKSRAALLMYYRENGFTTVVVNFDIPDEILKERIESSRRDTAILRTVSSFREVLAQQKDDCGITETEKDIDYLFTIQSEFDFNKAISEILKIR
ncbi:hypothetical protein BN1080_02389 [Planococcus massiliensis]|uniref:Uncharacterized protein n=1 Tax=Planococcus massiliensis TaxID=1499687 RepID=A0A098EMA3_9BACL|nr:AAA family ATPase [Planococcus massiliensis]CEG23413.1 hypothetical protein BN1080_02389 [Planococcus massiliensis]